MTTDRSYAGRVRELSMTLQQISEGEVAGPGALAQSLGHVRNDINYLIDDLVQAEDELKNPPPMGECPSCHQRGKLGEGCLRCPGHWFVPPPLIRGVTLVLLCSGKYCVSQLRNTPRVSVEVPAEHGPDVETRHYSVGDTMSEGVVDLLVDQAEYDVTILPVSRGWGL